MRRFVRQLWQLNSSMIQWLQKKAATHIVIRRQCKRLAIRWLWHYGVLSPCWCSDMVTSTWFRKRCVFPLFVQSKNQIAIWLKKQLWLRWFNFVITTSLNNNGECHVWLFVLFFSLHVIGTALVIPNGKCLNSMTLVTLVSRGIQEGDTNHEYHESIITPETCIPLLNGQHSAPVGTEFSKS